MSGLTPLPIVNFRSLLRGRGCSITALEAELGVAHNTLWRALRGLAAPDELRKRIHACTTADEWAQLCQLEHWHTWNNAQAAVEASAAPGEYHWVMRQECAHCHGDRRFVPCCRSQARQLTHGICATCFPILYPGFAAAVANPAAA